MSFPFRLNECGGDGGGGGGMEVLLFAECLLHAGAETLEGRIDRVSPALLSVRDAVEITAPVPLTAHCNWVI